MRTTIDIPEHLLRQAKSTAALRGIKLKDLVTSMFEREFATPNSIHPAVSKAEVSGEQKRAVPRPLPDLSPILAGRRLPVMTNREIDELLAQDEQDRLEKAFSSGRQD